MTSCRSSKVPRCERNGLPKTVRERNFEIPRSGTKASLLEMRLYVMSSDSSDSKPSEQHSGRVHTLFLEKERDASAGIRDKVSQQSSEPNRLLSQFSTYRHTRRNFSLIRLQLHEHASDGRGDWRIQLSIAFMALQ